MCAQSLFEFGGQGPALHLAVANGFPPLTYRPLLEPLLDSYRVISLPPRALWPGIGAPPEQPGSWRELADDLLAGLRQHNLTDVIAVGHSFGGVASLLAALAEPQRFRALILLDPTIFPPPVMDAIRALRQQDGEARLPLVETALKRRSRFADADEAFAYWRGKMLFSDWSAAALRLYTESMTRPTDEGDLTLTWSPAWEAYYYQSIYADTWDDLPRLDGLLPTLVIAGETTTTFVHEARDLAREVLPRAAHATIAGHGHLFPHSAPGETARVIRDWLCASGLC
jgi:pimeloyl-ACP methyl ester carboxylesterase